LIFIPRFAAIDDAQMRVLDRFSAITTSTGFAVARKFVTSGTILIVFRAFTGKNPSQKEDVVRGKIESIALRQINHCVIGARPANEHFTGRLAESETKRFRNRLNHRLVDVLDGVTKWLCPRMKLISSAFQPTVVSREISLVNAREKPLASSEPSDANGLIGLFFGFGLTRH
jgi:hypothetical protein